MTTHPLWLEGKFMWRNLPLLPCFLDARLELPLLIERVFSPPLSFTFPQLYALLCDPESSLSCTKCPPLGTIMSQLRPIHTITSRLSKTSVLKVFLTTSFSTTQPATVPAFHHTFVCISCFPTPSYPYPDTIDCQEFLNEATDLLV